MTEQNKTRKFLKDNIVVLFFLLLAIAAIFFSGSPLTSVGADASSRFFRNILLITALILPIMSGVGLNFGITLGAMAAQLAFVLICILRIDDQPLSIVYWIVLTILISVVCGKLLAILFNKTKGHEMIAGLLVGFFANGIYQFLLMVVCGDILKLDIDGLVLSKGLPIKSTIRLSDSLATVLDRAFPIAYFFMVYAVVAVMLVYFGVKLVKALIRKEAKEKKIQGIAGIAAAIVLYAACMYIPAVRKMVASVNFPAVTALISAVVIAFVSRLMKSKIGHDFISIRNDRHIAASVGIDVDKCRTKSIILSTVIAGLGQVLYVQNLGTLNTYIMHNSVATYAIAAILIGGATVRNANIKNVLIGNILFQIIYGCAPNAAKTLVGNTQVGEYFRVFLCYAIIAAAIVSNAIRESKATEKRNQGI